jgi:hypothetical protein
MLIEMMTKNPQRSEWSLEEDTIIQRQNPSNKNKDNNVASSSIMIDVNQDDSRKYEKTK